MKKSIWLLVATLVIRLALPVFAQEYNFPSRDELIEGSIQFRGFEWGDSLKVVAEKEITDSMIEGVDYDISEDAHELDVLTTAGNMDVIACFVFNEDWNLISGGYLPNTNRTTILGQYGDYALFHLILTTLYGDPTLDLSDGFDDLDNMRTEDIISDLTNNGSVIMKAWVASDLTCAMVFCVANGANIQTFVMYFPSLDQAQLYLSSFFSTEGF